MSSLRTDELAAAVKLLVLAQTPPPVHGQSVMVRTLIDGLPAYGIELEHVNLKLSRSSADIGGWRFGKLLAVFDACFHAIAARFLDDCDTLYYVPAPGKRGALYRDWAIMILCRPFFRNLILHWHATGLGVWLQQHAWRWERLITQALLGRADLSIVLADSLRPDAAVLSPRQIAVVPNGIVDPRDSVVQRWSAGSGPFKVLFLGLCSEEKGLFAAATAVLAANRITGARHDTPAFTFVAAGPFSDANTGSLFMEICRQYPAICHYAGLVRGTEKEDLFRRSHCLFLPTRYPAEGQPLVLLEALAHDLPVIATRWRAIPETLPPEAMLVEPGDMDALARAVVVLSKSPPSIGSLRQHYLAHYTADHHLAAFAAALYNHS